MIYFWEVFEEFTQEQRQRYLKFTWGRSRLSASNFYEHKLNSFNKQGMIPIAHTCFFSLDIGLYKSKEELKSKLLYAIDNALIISEDYGTIDLDIDDEDSEEASSAIQEEE